MIPFNSLTARLFLEATFDVRAFNNRRKDSSSQQTLNLSDINLQGKYLDGIDFSNALIRKGNFKEAVLRGADFRNSDLSGADFSYALLDDADFRNSILRGTNFSGTRLVQTDFRKANLFNTNFSSARSLASDFREANIQWTDFTNAKLHEYISDINLENIRQYEFIDRVRSIPLSGDPCNPGVLQDLQIYFPNIILDDLVNFGDEKFWVILREGKVEARLPKTVIHIIGTNFSGLNLTTCKFEKASFRGAILRDANLQSLDLTQVNLGEANLCNANLSGARLVGAILTRAIAKNANLREANLGANDYYNGVDCERTDFRGANLSKANFAATIDRSRNLFPGANFYSADLSNANLSEANLRGINCNNAILRSANLEKCKLGSPSFPFLPPFKKATTTFHNADLSYIKNADTCEHQGESSIDEETLWRSPGIPLSFFRNCGIDYKFDEYDKMHRGILYYSCFLSYSSKDRTSVSRIYEILKTCHLACFFDVETLSVGKDFERKIRQALSEYDKLVVILSKNSLKSSPVGFEVNTALQMESKNPDKVIPISIESIELLLNERTLPDWFKKIKNRQIIDFTIQDTPATNFYTHMNKLLGALKRRPS